MFAPLKTKEISFSALQRFEITGFSKESARFLHNSEFLRREQIFHRNEPLGAPKELLLKTFAVDLINQGSVYTIAVSFATASLSMQLHLPLTRRRSRPLSKPGRFENADKSGLFSKRYGFICRVNGETASI